MIIENHPLMFDPTVRTEGEWPYAKFPIGADTHQREKSQENQTAEEADFMAAEDKGRKAVKVPRQVLYLFSGAAAGADRPPFGCAVKRVLEISCASEMTRRYACMQERGYSTPLKMGRDNRWCHVIQRAAWMRSDMKAYVLTLIRIARNQLHLEQTVCKSGSR